MSIQLLIQQLLILQRGIQVNLPLKHQRQVILLQQHSTLVRRHKLPIQPLGQLARAPLKHRRQVIVQLLHLQLLQMDKH